MDLFTYPAWLFPVTPEYWHPAEGRWFQTQGADGIAPTGPLKKLTDLYVKLTTEKDLAARHEMVREAVRIHIDEGPFTIGTVGRQPIPVLVSNRFHNVPMNGITGPWAIAQPATSYPEQYFIRDDGS
jgi:peptide/nickel transport system substrate-binding protein